jgi:hypothetical protein
VSLVARRQGYTGMKVGAERSRLRLFSTELGSIGDFSDVERIERGLVRSERRALTIRINSAIPIPRAALKATKHHRAGSPKRKIRALPAEKSRPMNPPPTGSLCIVIPGCGFSVIETSPGIMVPPEG